MRIVGNPPSGGKKPGTPTIGTATAGDASATVAYTAPSYTGKGGTVTYRALSTPGSLEGTGASPITVSGLTNGTSYTFQVRTETAYGVNGDYSTASGSVTPAAAGSFESIATVTATGGEASLEFSSIASTYQHLQIRALVRDSWTIPSGYNNVVLQFNSDTGSNYSYHRLAGSGTDVYATGWTNQTYIIAEAIGTYSGGSNTLMYGTGVIDIHDYASTTKNKTVRCFGGANINASSGRVALSSGLWQSTSAISTITLSASGDTFASGTTFALYGIKG